jgi:hypothetical protein
MDTQNTGEAIHERQLRLQSAFNGGEFLLPDASKTRDLLLRQIALATDASEVAANIFQHDTLP